MSEAQTRTGIISFTFTGEDMKTEIKCTREEMTIALAGMFEMMDNANDLQGHLAVAMWTVYGEKAPKILAGVALSVVANADKLRAMGGPQQ